jgi:hypothetical protein
VTLEVYPVDVNLVVCGLVSIPGGRVSLSKIIRRKPKAHNYKLSCGQGKCALINLPVRKLFKVPNYQNPPSKKNENSQPSPPGSKKLAVDFGLVYPLLKCNKYDIFILEVK